MYLGNGVRYSDLVEIFYPQAGYQQSQLVTFPKNHFAAIFGGHLEFLRKTQKRIILETMHDRVILLKFLIARLSPELTGEFFQKSFSRHF